MLLEHFKEAEFTSTGIVSQCTGLAAVNNRALAVGLHKLNPKLCRSSITLGWLLKRSQAKVIDGWRLCGKPNKHKGHWVYWFVEGMPEGLTQQESDERYDACKTLSRKLVENSRQIEQLPEPEQYKTETTITSDGHFKTTLQIDPRTGAPLVQKPAPAASAPEPAPTVGPKERPRIPPWIQRGELNPRDKAEWKAWQVKRLEVWSPDGLWHDEPDPRAFEYASHRDDIGIRSGWQPNGIRQHAGYEVSTLWKGTLKDL